MGNSDARMDAVIAWVDGSDPKHAAKRKAAMQRMGLSDGTTMNFASETRFSDLGEIYYCVASILKYASFIHRIYIIADDQAPAQIEEFARQGICAPDRIRIVDHTEIFRGYLNHLPTFNCRTIEALIWNIENISEYFLYFNDDFFLNAPLTFGDLVLPDGRLRLEGEMRPIAGKLRKQRFRQMLNRLLGRKHMATRSNLAQAMAAQIVGHDEYLTAHHNPRPLRTRTLRDYFANHPELLDRQLGHPFRSVEQFSPYVLANHLELEAGTAVVEPVSPTVYLTPSNVSDTERQIGRIDSSEAPFGCVQSLDEFSDERRATLRAALARKFADVLPEGLDLP